MIFHNKSLSTLLFVSINSIHLTLTGLWQLYDYLNVITKELSRDLLATVNCLVAVSNTSLGRNPNTVTINYLSAKILGLRPCVTVDGTGFLIRAWYGSSYSTTMSLHVFFYCISTSIQSLRLHSYEYYLIYIGKLSYSDDYHGKRKTRHHEMSTDSGPEINVFSGTVLKNIINDQ